MKINRAPVGNVKNETEIANFIDADGQPVVTHWYEPSPVFYSPDLTKIRNRANTEFWKLDGMSSGEFTFIESLNGNKVSTKNKFFDVPLNLTEYTVFAVAAISQEFADATGILNTALFGTAKEDGTKNAPYLAYSNGGFWRVFGLPKGQDEQLRANMSKATAMNTHLYTLSRSALGVSLRIDGVEIISSVAANAKVQTNAKEMRFMGFDVISGGFNGTVGNIIVCKKDLRNQPQMLQKIESYLMSKYVITTA